MHKRFAVPLAVPAIITYANVILTGLLVVVLLVISQAARSDPGGAGGLLVAPTRLVFENRVRSQELTLVNTGDETATYRITLTQLRMANDGSMSTIDTPDPNAPFAVGLVRWSPREVTLEPRASQVVRVALRLPQDLPVGEYRSALKFSALPPVENSIEKTEAPTNGISIRLRVMTSVSIPLIVRHGTAPATATLSGAALRGGILEATLGRDGQESIFGDLRAVLIPTTGRTEVEVGVMRGVAVYAENASRKISLPLTVPPHVNLSDGTIKLEFTTPGKQKAPPLATTTVPLV